MLIGLYIVDAIIIAIVFYGCCCVKPEYLLSKTNEEDYLDIENPNYLSFEESELN